MKKVVCKLENSSLKTKNDIFNGHAFVLEYIEIESCSTKVERGTLN